MLPYIYIAYMDPMGYIFSFLEKVMPCEFKVDHEKPPLALIATISHTATVLLMVVAVISLRRITNGSYKVGPPNDS